MKPNDIMDGKDHQKTGNSRTKRCLSDSDRFDQLTVNVENLIHKMEYTTIEFIETLQNKE